MPTVLPARPATAAAIQLLSWPDTVRLVILAARVRWLNRRLEAADRRVERHGLDLAGAGLVLAARRWLACHEAIGALLGIPEPPEVAQMRTLLFQGHRPACRAAAETQEL